MKPRNPGHIRSAKGNFAQTRNTVVSSVSLRTRSASCNQEHMYNLT